MRPIVLITTLFLVACNYSYAQDQAPSGISSDLCNCFDQINPEISDTYFERAIRNCLENALLNNPTELDQMVKLREGTTHKGFSIGQWLGSLLQNNCPTFKGVQERMRKMDLKLTQNLDHAPLGTS